MDVAAATAPRYHVSSPGVSSCFGEDAVFWVRTRTRSRDTLRTPPAYYRAFEADTDSIVIINELRSFLTLQNYNGFELQLSPLAYERAESYLDSASHKRKLLSPEFTPDGDGGIDAEWENHGRRLVLSCRKHIDEDFISWREANGRYEGNTASQALLDQKLEWLFS